MIGITKSHILIKERKIYMKNWINLKGIFIISLLTYFLTTNQTNAIILPSHSEWVTSYTSDVFPDTYQSQLNDLKKKHPNWIFKAVYTNLNWNMVLNHQSNSYLSGINTIHQSYSNEWKYNGRNEYADGSFVKASDPAISYTLDPRNSLTEERIFQFEYIGYSPSVHTESSVSAILKNTLMGEAKKSQYKVYGGSWVNLGTTYSNLLLNIGRSQGISPVHMASRIRQETSCDLANNPSINGQHVTYRSKYNFFNIKATPDANGNNAATNGLKYAASQNWVNPQNSISGGTSTLQRYINNDQNTIYFEKFPTNNEGRATKLLGTGYMTNIMAPINESKTTYLAYKNAGVLESAFEFHIPVYQNMPDICLNPSLVSEYQDDNTRIYLDHKTNDTYYLKNGDENNILTIQASPTNFLSKTPNYVIYRKRNYTYSAYDYVEVYQVSTGNTYYGLIEKKYITVFPTDQLDKTPPTITIDYRYQEETNTILVTLKSNELLRQTKPTWKLSNDKTTYTKVLEDNMTYSTPVMDLSKNVTNVTITVSGIDRDGPNITLNYTLNEDHSITATALSDEPLQDSKPTWTLSEDLKTYTKIFPHNQNYSTDFKDRYGNTSLVKIETYLLPMEVTKTYHYDDIKNTVTAYIYNEEGFEDTKPTWTLSNDLKTYSKVFDKNQVYSTPFQDKTGNIDQVEIAIRLIDDSPPELEINYLLNEDNSVTATVTANKPFRNTKPTWSLSEDNLTYTKTFTSNQNYTTPFVDHFGNSADLSIQFDLIQLRYQIDYIYNTDQSITVHVNIDSGFRHTKPTWTLSKDQKTYSKTFTTDEDYFTDFTDIYGNQESIQIVIHRTD